MSIKIYDGLKSKTANIFELNRQIREVVEPLFLERFKEIYLEYSELFSHGEGIFVNLKDIPKYFYDTDVVLNKRRLDKVLHSEIENLNKMAEHTFSEADICYEILIIENALGLEPLVLVFGENSRVYSEALLAAHVVEEYGYWDNTDPEENVSEEDWEKRRSEWARLLGNASPSEIGLGISSPGLMQTSLSVFENKYNWKK